MRLRVLALSFATIFLLAIPAFAQQQSDGQRELAEYIRENYSKREVMIPVRDGVKLFTAIYEPKKRSQKYPIMLQRTPYSVSPYGANNMPGQLGPDHLFAREGYIFAYQDVRGRFMSEGEFDNIRADIPNTKPSEIDESTDAYDTIDWLIKNVANNNGRVGMYGISYEPGGYQMLLRGEPMPARFRNGFEKPEPLAPNRPTALQFVMPGIAHTFKKGHRIMVQIQSTWFPLVARNPQRFVANYKLATARDFQKATQRVYHGGRTQSSIILRVLK